jgi:ubiquinone biosynthesis protein COQ9
MAKAAKKPAKAKARAKTGSKSRAGAKTRVVDAAGALRGALLKLVETQGWRDLSLAEIAAEAGLPIAEAHAIYPSKAAILVGLVRELDEEILGSLAAEPLDGSAKDQLFDLLMRRFDALNRHRGAYLALIRELPTTPIEFGCMTGQVRRSLGLMLETAGLSASGLKGLVRVNGLMAIYASALRVWPRDDSADLAKTMAELDKRLGQAERLSGMLHRRAA